MPTRQLQIVAAMLLIALMLPSAAIAQPMEKEGLVLNARNDVFLYSKLKNPTAGTFEEEAKVLVNDFYADAAWYGLKLGERTSFVPMASYRGLALRYQDWAPRSPQPAVFKPTGLHALKLHLKLKHAFSSGWTLTGVVSPGIVSDFRNVDSDHWKVDGKIFASKMRDANLTYGIGAIIDRRFGELFVLPALQVKYRINEKSYINMMAPKYAEYWNQAWEDIALGFGIWFDGDEFARGREIEGQAENQPKGTSVRYSVGTLGPMGKYTLPNGWKVTGSLGLAFLRRFEVYNETTDITTEYDLKETVFFRLTAHVM